MIRKIQNIRKPDGSLVFNLVLTGTCCKRCAKSKSPWLCDHNPAEIPNWESTERAEKWFKLMEAEHMGMSAIVEWMSMMVANDETRFFDDTLINDLRIRNRFVPQPDEEADVVAIGIDTAGYNSCLGVGVFAKYGRHWVVRYFYFFVRAGIIIWQLHIGSAVVACGMDCVRRTVCE